MYCNGPRQAQRQSKTNNDHSSSYLPRPGSGPDRIHPVSSTAHLVFAARLVDLYGGADKTLQAEQTTATIAVIQLGTLLAVLIYFARDIVNILRAFIYDHLALLRGRNATGPAKTLKRCMAGLAGDHRFASGRHDRIGVEETDRRTIHEEPLGDRDDDDRRRRVADDRRAGGKERSRMDQLRVSRRARGWLGAGTGIDSRFESLGLDDHGRVCLPA